MVLWLTYNSRVQRGGIRLIVPKAHKVGRAKICKINKTYLTETADRWTTDYRRKWITHGKKNCTQVQHYNGRTDMCSVPNNKNKICSVRDYCGNFFFIIKKSLSNVRFTSGE